SRRRRASRGRQCRPSMHRERQYTILVQMLDLLDELRNVIARIDDAGVPYALCGGLAMAVHGYPRATVDIDLLVLVDDLARVDAAVRPLGFVVPAEPMTFKGGAVEIRRVSKTH